MHMCTQVKVATISFGVYTVTTLHLSDFTCQEDWLFTGSTKLFH